MVDAIGSVTNKMLNRLKEPSISWTKLTAGEIQEYKGQGQDIPVAILKWAEEIIKLANAPDDVTYDMVNGKTNLDDIYQILAVSENEDTKEKDANDKDETNADTNMNKAQSERSVLKEGGTPLSEQGKVFMDKSREAASNTDDMVGALMAALDESAALADSADDIAKQTENKTGALKTEYDALVARAKEQSSEPLTKAEQDRLKALGVQLTQIGTAAQGTLAGLSAQADALKTTVSGFSGIPENAIDYGIETADIGLELMGVSDDKRNSVMDKASAASGIQDGALSVMRENSKLRFGRMMFDADYRLGVKASRQGGADMDTGASGETQRAVAESKVETDASKINLNKTDVQNATYIPAQDTSDKSDGNKSEQKDNKDETDVKDITLADEKITTDPNEIQKRKERRGLA